MDLIASSNNYYVFTHSCKLINICPLVSWCPNLVTSQNWTITKQVRNVKLGFLKIWICQVASFLAKLILLKTRVNTHWNINTCANSCNFIWLWFTKKANNSIMRTRRVWKSEHSCPDKTQGQTPSNKIRSTFLAALHNAKTWTQPNSRPIENPLLFEKKRLAH